MKYAEVVLLFLLLMVISCNTIEKNNDNSLRDSSKIAHDSISTKIDTLEIIVVQCANGYEYAIHNFDFNPVIENELNKFENIKVKPFPLNELIGIAYQGVFDKKYCTPIIEKVNVDFLILTRFDKKYDALNPSQMKWGYELRIVNTETLEQINTISAHDLNDYSDIEKHLKDNIEKLKRDIERLK